MAHLGARDGLQLRTRLPVEGDRARDAIAALRRRHVGAELLGERLGHGRDQLVFHARPRVRRAARALHERVRREEARRLFAQVVAVIERELVRDAVQVQRHHGRLPGVVRAVALGERAAQQQQEREQASHGPSGAGSLLEQVVLSESSRRALRNRNARAHREVGAPSAPLATLQVGAFLPAMTHRPTGRVAASEPPAHAALPRPSSPRCPSLRARRAAPWQRARRLDLHADRVSFAAARPGDPRMRRARSGTPRGADALDRRTRAACSRSR